MGWTVSRVTWKDDRVFVGDVVFHLEDVKYDPGPLDAGSFRLYKPKRMLLDYERLWARRPEFQPESMLELGIWNGGSIVFWWELWKPQRFVALDIQSCDDGEDLKRWKASRGLETRVKTHWRTNQADAGRLRNIVQEDLAGHLDLVIDDASHMYNETKKSFEVLFPLLRPGGIYVIEDWSWGCWPGLPLDFPIPHGTELPRLVAELVNATGSIARTFVDDGRLRVLATTNPLIAMLEVHPDFVVLERGTGKAPPDFALDSYITCRPKP